MARRSVWVQMEREAERRRRDAERAARALEKERQRQAKEAAPLTQVTSMALAA